MKQIKKLVMALVMVVMFGSLVACVGDSSENAETQASESATAEGQEATMEEEAETTSMEEGEAATLVMYIANDATSEEIAVLRDIITKFEEKNVGATIDLISTGDPTGLATQQIAAGGGPDVLEIDATNAQLYASAGYIYELDEYAKQYGWYDLFDQWVLDLATRDGKMIAVPIDTDGLIVYYNKTMFEENGWSIPTTYQEYIDLCDSIKAADVVPIAFGNADFEAANQWWLSMGYTVSLGQEKYHDLLQGRLAWESDEVRTATEQLVSMWENGYIYEHSASITTEDARNMFINGQAAMMMAGQWEAAEIINGEPTFDWSAYKMPSWNSEIEDGALPVALGGVYVINKQSEYPDLVAEFLNELYSDEYIETKVAQGRIYPTTNGDPNNVEGLDRQFVEIFDIILNEMEEDNIGYCTWTYWPVSTDTYAWDNLSALYLKQLTIDEYLRNLQEKFDEDVENGNVLEF